MRLSSPRRLRPLFLVLGVVVAALPLVGARELLSSYAGKVAQGEVDDIAGQMLFRAEAAIGESLDALTDLAVAGVTTCSNRDLDLLRRAAYENYSVKELGVTDASGRIVCNHLGDDVEVTALSARIESERTANVTFQVVSLGAEGRVGLMLTWALDAGGGLSAVVPAQLVVPDVLPVALRESGYGRVALSDGTLIRGIPEMRLPRTGAETAAAFYPAEDLTRSVQALRTSAPYPIEVGFAVPTATFRERTAGIETVANTAGLVVGTIIFSLAFWGLRRSGPVGEMSDAVERGEFIPYYQPVIDIREGRLLGCELLVRWRKPSGRIIPPGAFIALAEATGLAMDMTRSLMVQARRDLDGPFGDRPDLYVGINLFGAHFESLRIVDEVKSIFGNSRVAFGQLLLEMTERQPVSDPDRARAVIRRLRQLGARIAIDDAGTGHSGLANLQLYSPDVLKIDKLFVDTIGTVGGTPVIESMIKLGHDLGMEVVAEGVETWAQVEYLRARGVTSAQGYLFAPPLPARSFLRLVEALAPLTRTEDDGQALAA